MVGQTVSHYRIVKEIGAGGMGVVYLAQDTRLNRNVALKFLPPSVARDDSARERFTREAQAASTLDQINVATIYEIGEWQDQLFIAMAFYEGETLKARIERGAMSIPEIETVMRELATGLAAAHRQGIVHRDLKPANVLLTRDGPVKILDFGLAKSSSATAETATRLTNIGTTVGTLAYMSPEQAQGSDVDARADIWALGVIGYEMLTGRLPFKAETMTAALLAMMTEQPPAVRSLRADAPESLVRIVDAALTKSVDRRSITAQQIAQELTPASGPSIAVPHARGLAGRGGVAAAVVVTIAAVIAIGWFVRRGSAARWAREQAVPEIERLIEREQFVAAFQLAQRAKQELPTDPVWQRLDPLISRPVSVESDPSGATVSYRDYRDSSAVWTVLGSTPIKDATIPNGFFAWKVEKPGFVTAMDVAGVGGVIVPGNRFAFVLQPEAKRIAGMNFVSAGPAPYRLFIPGLDHLPPSKLHDFWIDKYEVTNRDFKRFIDAGGYGNPSYWREPFIRDGKGVAPAEAMRSFVDTTGRPGPATWELGSFPEGQEDYPVTGVSWYEAAAYAAYADKALPTIYHWSRVAEQRSSQYVVPKSNFGGRGPLKVGVSGADNRFGAVDMAGNVKEWCWNRAGGSKRYVLGGGWDEPAYMFNDPDARDPMDRSANVGFRCVKYSPGETLIAQGAQLIPFVVRDFSSETPVSDQVFEAYRRLYAYDRTPLDVRVDAVDDSNPDWRRERVSYAAAYGNERIPAWVYLPRRVAPPYQAVLYFPGANALQLRSGEPGARLFDWILKSGRAVILPIYKSTYERGDEVRTDYPSRTNVFRDHVIAWSKDVGRSVDYLQSRDDISKTALAYMGLSWGAAMGPLFVANDSRFKACVLVLGGFYLQHSAPEADVFNFAPRMKTPVLLLSGRFDFFFPVETSEMPFFQRLGVPDQQKRRVVYDTGHNIPRADLVRESLDWLDRYLGPVR